MFWFFFFWLLNTVTPSISKVGGSGSREYRMSVSRLTAVKRRRRHVSNAHQSLHLRQPRQMIRSFARQEVQLSIFVRYVIMVPNRTNFSFVGGFRTALAHQTKAG